MPAALPEQTIVDLMLLGLGSELSKRDSLRFLKDTRLMKMSFAIAEGLDLPVTRGWYQYGWFIYGQEITVDRLMAAIDRTPTSEALAQRLQALIAGPAKSLYRELHQEAVRVVERYHRKSTEEIIKEIYSHDAPERFRSLYLANWDYRELTQELTQDALQSRLPGSLWEDYSSSISSMHVAASTFPDGNIRDILFDCSSFLELLVIKADSAPGNLPSGFAEFLQDVGHLYVGRVWRFPAAWIFRETVHGPQAEAAKADMEGYLKTLPAMQRLLASKRDDAKRRSFLPSADEMDTVVERSKERLGRQAAGAVDDLFAYVGGGVDGSGSGP